MLLVTYDISDNKLRTQFSKFLERYGYRLQYSIFEIKNSEKILNNIRAEIQGRFEKKFTASDSVLIIPVSEVNEKKIEKYGYAKDLDSDIIFV